MREWTRNIDACKREGIILLSALRTAWVSHDALHRSHATTPAIRLFHSPAQRKKTQKSLIIETRLSPRSSRFSKWTLAQLELLFPLTANPLEVPKRQISSARVVTH